MDINFFVKEKMNIQIIDKFNEIKKTEEKEKSNIINKKNILIILNCNCFKKMVFVL